MEAAGAWLLEQPEDSNRDQLIESYVNTIGHQDPEMGVLWASGMMDERKREMMVQQYARNWLRNDKEKATEWIQSSDLSEETVNRLLNNGRSTGVPTELMNAPAEMDIEMMRRYGLTPP